MSKIKVILIHGNNTTRWSYKWMPWVKKELEKLELEVIGETFPDSILAREKYWIPFLKERLHADQNTILIGHSSGADAAMRYAENNKLLGTILVSPAYTDLNDDLEKQSGYFNRPWQWDKIKANQKWIIQFGSQDDPYIPLKEFRHIHKMLDTQYFEFADRGHFMENQDTFPEIIKVIKEKLKL
ncbi:alpha/beta hydrolase [Patescibacteria group bacterium]|nr:alpha/beta hydrolase [Patescibacteria group bacterium]